MLCVYLAAGLACILRQHDDSVMKGFEIVKLARSLVIGRRTTAADSRCKVLPTESWLLVYHGEHLGIYLPTLNSFTSATYQPSCSQERQRCTSNSLYRERPRTCLTFITDFNDNVLEIMQFTNALHLAVFGLATLGSSMPVAGGPNSAVNRDAAPGGPTPAVMKRDSEALPEPQRPAKRDVEALPEPFPDPLPEP